MHHMRLRSPLFPVPARLEVTIFAWYNFLLTAAISPAGRSCGTVDQTDNRNRPDMGFVSQLPDGPIARKKDPSYVPMSAAVR